MFTHNLFPRTELTSFEDKGGRFYNLPNGTIVESVTTRLGKTKLLPKEWIAKWKKRVGEQKANQITTQAFARGTAIHGLAEKYLLNDPAYAKGVMPVNLSDFLRVREVLDKNVTEVHGLEFPLYSYEYKTAGRADLYCSWNHKPTIVDYKTARKPKEEKDLLGYFLQATAYALMAGLIYVPTKQIAIIMIASNEHPQVFVKDIDEFIPLVTKIFKDGQ
jgi:genome maintenance exonuclease 1